MYDVTIQNGNEIITIHDHHSTSTSQKLASGSIVDAENSISSFTFTIYPNNAGYDKLNAYTTLIKVRNTNRSRDDFVGRVLQVSPEMDSSGMVSKTVVCEDRLGFLHDSVQPYADVHHYVGDTSRSGLEEFIDVVLANHNAQVEENKRIYRGTVTVKPFESSNDVTKGLNWQSTFDTIKEKLLNSFGGFIRLRESAGVLYLDYLESVGATRSTTIELGRNMRSASKEVDPSGIVTRLIPLGAKLVKNDGNGNEVETEERLTITNVNEGLNYIESIAYAEQFGIRYGTVIFDDVTDANNLLRKGTDWLAANNGLAISHNVDALDLSLLGLDIDDFVLYDSYPVKNQLIGTNDILKIIKKTTNIIEPQNSSFEMGAITKRLSDMIIDEILNIGAINGKNSYLHLRYSANADGSGMTEQPTDTTKYIGTHSSMNAEAPTDPSAYKWSLIRGSDGKDGTPGKDGASGVGIKNVVNYYLASNLSSGVTISTSGWTTDIQVVSSTKKYLWNYEVITYTNNSTTTTTPCIIGNYANDGINGIDGEDGVGISEIKEYYARSTSNTIVPDSWTTDVPTLTPTYKYLWNYETIIFTNNTAQDTAKRVIGVYGDTGAPGKDGAAGAPGVGVERIVPRYAVGTSDTVAPSTPTIAGWSIAAPELSYGEFLWCAYYIQYTDGTDAWTEPFHARSADQIKQAESAPENPTVGTLWLDTTSTPYLLKRYDGTDWVVVADYSSEFEDVYTYVNEKVVEYGETVDGLAAKVEEETVSKSIYEEFSITVKNILNMEADGTTMIFQTINEAIQEVGNIEQTHYAELLTYIRFSENGIEIGKEGNAITMQLDNDSLDFYNNGTRVAYISDNQLYISDGRFLRSVRIGNYGFIPEANGSVSFTYLGGDS